MKKVLSINKSTTGSMYLNGKLNESTYLTIICRVLNYTNMYTVQSTCNNFLSYYIYIIRVLNYRHKYVQAHSNSGFRFGMRKSHSNKSLPVSLIILRLLYCTLATDTFDSLYKWTIFPLYYTYVFQMCLRQ